MLILSLSRRPGSLQVPRLPQYDGNLQETENFLKKALIPVKAKARFSLRKETLAMTKFQNTKCFQPVRRSITESAAAESLRRQQKSSPPEAASQSLPNFNDAESPLSWLRSRKSRNGKPMISDAQYIAGERLRFDFERAMLARRTTTNWDTAGTGGRSGNTAAELSDGAVAARQRYHQALDAVGPELASILQQVCCMMAGIEEAERALDLPQRSGRAVLGLGLTALARHYGLLGQGARKSGPLHWAASDYRPSIAGREGA